MPASESFITYSITFVVWDTVVRMANYHVFDSRGSNTGGDDIFRNRLDRPWSPPCLLYRGYRAIPGGKAVRAWRWKFTPIWRRGYRKIRAIPQPPSEPSWPAKFNLPHTITFDIQLNIYVSDICWRLKICRVWHRRNGKHKGAALIQCSIPATTCIQRQQISEKRQQMFTNHIGFYPRRLKS
jgi:hypothetical protein